MQRLRFKVSLNGCEVCTAGLDLPGTLLSQVRYTRLARVDAQWVPSLFAGTPEGEDYEVCELTVTGSSTNPSEELGWLRERLRAGDEVTLEVLDGGPSDPPTGREADVPF
jgi:hypothetical protein